MSYFTKEDGIEAKKALMELGKALSKPKLREFFGHLNEIAIFIETAIHHAPAAGEPSDKERLDAMTNAAKRAGTLTILEDARVAADIVIRMEQEA